MSSIDKTRKVIDTNLIVGKIGGGENGATFIPIPTVTEPNTLHLEWTNDKGLPNPSAVDIVAPKGEKGEQGEQGLQGLQGIQGEQGLKGDTGEQGIQGIQGIPGEKGDKGDKGDTGEQGIQGLQGERGEKGEQGLQGIQGEKGADGYTPIKGTDYFTEAEKTEIEENVKTDLEIIIPKVVRL